MPPRPALMGLAIKASGLTSPTLSGGLPSPQTPNEIEVGFAALTRNSGANGVEPGRAANVPTKANVPRPPAVQYQNTFEDVDTSESEEEEKNSLPLVEVDEVQMELYFSEFLEKEHEELSDYAFSLVARNLEMKFTDRLIEKLLDDR